MILIDSSFWRSVGVTKNNINTNGNQKDFYNSMFVNGVTIYNQKEFFENSTIDGVVYNNQYDWYKAIGTFHSEPIYDQYSFMQNVTFDGVNAVGNQKDFFSNEAIVQSLCSYYFNGTDANADLGSQLNAVMEGAATFSLRVVFRFTELGTNQWLFSNDVSFRINRNAANNNLWIWYNNGANVVKQLNVALGLGWYELILTYDEGVTTYYINSVAPPQQFILGTAIPTSLGTTGIVPKLASFDTTYGKSYINQVQITSDVITQTEATNLYNSGLPLVGGDSLDNVVADYVFDNDTFDGTNWTLIDRSLNGNGITSNVDAVDKDCNENPY